MKSNAKKPGVLGERVLQLMQSKRPDSFSSKLRRKRFRLFRELISTLPRPLTILDVGGEPRFWEAMDFDCGAEGARITFLNKNTEKFDMEKYGKHPDYRFVEGDGTDMRMFREKEFDVVFSNSVIEHVFDHEGQGKMAEEIKRVGKRYFVQTPDYYFPIEVHSLIPFFQFMPLWLRTFLIRRCGVGFFKKASERDARELIEQPDYLLTEKKLRGLFPEARIRKEKVFGFTKSLIACGGWE